jgi:hypothetical protein
MNTDFSFLPHRSRTKAGLPTNFVFPSLNPQLSIFNFCSPPPIFRRKLAFIMPAGFDAVDRAFKGEL